MDERFSQFWALAAPRTACDDISGSHKNLLPVGQWAIQPPWAPIEQVLAPYGFAIVPQARVVIVTAPGQEAHVDYGTGPMVRDPESREYRRTRLFVMTLGCSRKSVRLLVFRSTARVWAELHEKASRRLGGATRIVVLDNLREGMLVPDLYDPALNPLYRDLLTHYGAVATPCRLQDPDPKGKLESGVGHAQRTALKGLRFASPEEAQTWRLVCARHKPKPWLPSICSPAWSPTS